MFRNTILDSHDMNDSGDAPFDVGAPPFVQGIRTRSLARTLRRKKAVRALVGSLRSTLYNDHRMLMTMVESEKGVAPSMLNVGTAGVEAERYAGLAGVATRTAAVDSACPDRPVRCVARHVLPSPTDPLVVALDESQLRFRDAVFDMNRCKWERTHAFQRHVDALQALDDAAPRLGCHRPDDLTDARDTAWRAMLSADTEMMRSLAAVDSARGRAYATWLDLDGTLSCLMTVYAQTSGHADVTWERATQLRAVAIRTPAVVPPEPPETAVVVEYTIEVEPAPPATPPGRPTPVAVPVYDGAVLVAVPLPDEAVRGIDGSHATSDGTSRSRSLRIAAGWALVALGALTIAIAVPVLAAAVGASVALGAWLAGSAVGWVGVGLVPRRSESTTSVTAHSTTPIARARVAGDPTMPMAARLAPFDDGARPDSS